MVSKTGVAAKDGMVKIEDLVIEGVTMEDAREKAFKQHDALAERKKSDKTLYPKNSWGVGQKLGSKLSNRGGVKATK